MGLTYVDKDARVGLAVATRELDEIVTAGRLASTTSDDQLGAWRERN